MYSGASLAAACFAIVCGWIAAFQILSYGPGMSKDKVLIGVAVALGALVPDLPALVALLDLHPVVSRAVCSVLLALATAYKLKPKAES